jgi:hypothetical protein
MALNVTYPYLEGRNRLSHDLYMWLFEEVLLGFLYSCIYPLTAMVFLVGRTLEVGGLVVKGLGQFLPEKRKNIGHNCFFSDPS